MRKISGSRRLASALFVLLLPLACAVAATSPAQAATGEISAVIRLAYTGSSSLHDWEGKAPAVTTTLHASPPGTPGTPGTWEGDFAVPIAGLDSGNATRDGNMREMFHADRHPDLHIALRAVDPAAVQRDHALKAALTIGEITHDVPVRVSNWKQASGQTSFDADAEVSLDAFGLEAPSVLGIVRVADVVKVKGHVELMVGGDPAPASEPKP